MKLLIIGGTRFLGRHLVDAARARGHELTLFNRGQRPDVFPDVEQLHGDRDGGLAVLQGRNWDAVIDTCGYFPRIVRASAVALSTAVERYVFISTISVYADFSKPGLDENAPVATLQDERVEEITPETYGALKALCEQAAEQALPEHTLIIRPGLIVGPYDMTDRFTYWPYRVAQGGEILAPGEADQQVQFIDVRDLAEWTIRMTEQRATGIYNATGPDDRLSMDQFLETCRTTTSSNARFVWVNEPFLEEHKIELPLWAPTQEAGVWAVNCRKALDEGLASRPLTQTIRDTLAWKNGAELHAGLTREREQELLHAWHELQTADNRE
jgi:2'-hydroxyisoflavone reductase